MLSYFFMRIWSGARQSLNEILEPRRVVFFSRASSTTYFPSIATNCGFPRRPNGWPPALAKTTRSRQNTTMTDAEERVCYGEGRSGCNR